VDVQQKLLSGEVPPLRMYPESNRLGSEHAG
jgi:hypothetical protein